MIVYVHYNLYFFYVFVNKRLMIFNKFSFISTINLLEVNFKFLLIIINTYRVTGLVWTHVIQEVGLIELNKDRME